MITSLFYLTPALMARRPREYGKGEDDPCEHS